MGGWMDVWVGGWMDEWMGGWLGGCSHFLLRYSDCSSSGSRNAHEEAPLSVISAICSVVGPSPHPSISHQPCSLRCQKSLKKNS